MARNRKSLPIVDDNQTGAWQNVNLSIPRFADASQLARLETAYLRWGTQRFGLAPLASLRRWPHE